MRPAVVAVLATTLLAAQEPPPPKPPAGRWLVDAIVATVNDTAILHSTLRTLTAGRIREQRTRFGPLTRTDEQLIERRVLDELIDKYRMAQSAKTFGPLTPEQIEQAFQSELKRDQQDQLRDLGSVNAVSQELKRTGRTWQTYEREQRVQKLSDFAEDLAVRRRLSRQTNLFLTPRMLRETYAQNRDRFVRPARARVAQVRFTGPDAEATAQQAADLWREQGLTARQLADRFPGAAAVGEVTAGSLSAEFGAIAAFALAGPVDQVSSPIPVRGGVHVARVTEFLPARNGRFEDSDVQDELRDLCYQRVLLEFREQAFERARLRTEVWQSKAVR